ncbi:MAG: OmpA/MotB family protein [Lewinella sp.]|jgi:chemotaxis protein MotB|uniref:OmpA/MotB family protein n=1 Tax=Lewinella sp. TaxID=2004506 RepID=UPI003D6B0D71
MKFMKSLLVMFAVLPLLISCVSKKQYDALQAELDAAAKMEEQCAVDISRLSNQFNTCEQERVRLTALLEGRSAQIQQLQDYVKDIQAQRDLTAAQLSNLTVLSQSANNNVSETLSQLDGKDKYIRMLQLAKTKADSINLALAVNLKGVLAKGIEDDDVEIQVDKTVVFINLSDKMLYESGSYNITARATEVLGKIAQIVQSRPDMEIMVEGYTDNVPISSACVKDNWDLSVLRATSVARALQLNHGVDPNRLIAAGRGQYNALASNDTAAGRSTNRRTRIIILPKLNQFYDLLNPELAAQKIN